MATSHLEAASAARASVLEDIHKMERELTDSQARVVQLERELQTERDRISLLAEERARYRDSERLYRGKLIELATSMANIGLLTQKAQEIMMTVKELEAGETKEQAQDERKSAADIVKRLVPRNADEAAKGVEELLTGAQAGSAASGVETRR